MDIKNPLVKAKSSFYDLESFSTHKYAIRLEEKWEVSASKLKTPSC